MKEETEKLLYFGKIKGVENGIEISYIEIDLNEFVDEVIKELENERQKGTTEP